MVLFWRHLSGDLEPTGKTHPFPAETHCWHWKRLRVMLSVELRRLFLTQAQEDTTVLILDVIMRTIRGGQVEGEGRYELEV